jgi:hypothetical protein
LIKIPPERENLLLWIGDPFPFPKPFALIFRKANADSKRVYFIDPIGWQTMDEPFCIKNETDRGSRTLVPIRRK